jgi:hypothetical protein
LKVFNCPQCAATLEFDRALVATDLVSKMCGEAMHRALRCRRESEETDLGESAFYAARTQSMRDAAAAILAEAEIILDRDLGSGPIAAPDEDEI